MRDPNRIDVFCKKFAELWKKNPDWRFGQTVVNYFGVDPFYVEDDRALEHIEKMIDKLNKLSKQYSEEQ